MIPSRNQNWKPSKMLEKLKQQENGKTAVIEIAMLLETVGYFKKILKEHRF